MRVPALSHTIFCVGRKILICLVCAAGAAVIGAQGAAWADPEPAPVLPNVNALAPVKPSEYFVLDNAWYAFAAPEGLTCILDRRTGGYGCSGPMPGAPNGANMVSGGAVGAPSFANTDRPAFAVAEGVKPLPANSRLSFREVSCGVDGGGMTSCVNSRDQTGFVISPAGSFIVGGLEP